MNELYQEQAQIELSMRAGGIDRYHMSYQRNVENKRETNNRPVNRLLSAAHVSFADSIDELKTKPIKRGKNLSAISLLLKLDTDIIAHLTLRLVLDSITQRISLTTVAYKIAALLQDEYNFQQYAIEYPERAACTFAFTQENDSYEYKVRKAEKGMALANYEKEIWDQQLKLKLGLLLIDALIASTGLIQTTLIQHKRGFKTSYIVEATDKTIEWMRTENTRVETLLPLYLPTVVPPTPWKTVYGGGYLTDAVKPLPLVKNQSPKYLRELEKIDMPVVYDALNALQNTAWKINDDILTIIHAYERNRLQDGLTEYEYEKLGLGLTIMLPQRPEWLDKSLKPEDMTHEQYELFKAWKHETARIKIINAQSRSKTGAYIRTIIVAERFRKYERIYFPHQLDWRGRAYPTPLYLQPQGSDVQRALLLFADAKPIDTQEQADWLAIHGAGLWGVDKIPFNERVEWVNKHEQEIIACAVDPFSNRFWQEAEKPWSALAFAFEWCSFKAHGWGYPSRLPVQMDGTCNGLQNFSAMLRDEIGGEAVNLVPSERPQDIYQRVADVVIARVDNDAAQGHDLAQRWQGHITRKVCKRPVMTLAYGARRYGYIDMILDDTINGWDRHTYPFEKYDQDTNKTRDLGFQAAQYLGNIIWESVGEVVIAAREAMDWLQSCAKQTAKHNTPIYWKTPSGFLVRQAYHKPQTIVVNTTFRKARLRTQLHVGELGLDKRKQSAGIAPNWVHSLDASHLALTIVSAIKHGIHSFCMIHDSYGTHAANAPAMSRILRDAFADMYQSHDVVSDIARDLSALLPDDESLPPQPKPGNLDLDVVRFSPYFFA